MKLRIISDLHTEFWGDNGNKDKLIRTIQYVLPELPEDKDSVLVLAGDTFSYHKKDKVEILMKYFENRFCNVIAIQGNHEPYGTSLSSAHDFYKKWGITDNTYFLEGCKNIYARTLWTDFLNANPLLMMQAKTEMNDYKQIEGLTPEDILQIHRRSLNDISNTIQEGDVVITHHAPGFRSIPEKFRHSTLNGCYYSNLDEFIEDKKPSLWVHGHVHSCSDYMIGSTRVLCNPYGYKGYESTKYNNKLIVEV